MTIANNDGRYTLIAQTLQGLEEVLAEELNQLGASSIEVLKRAVRFEGDQFLLMKANLWCRTALRISAELRSFRIRDAEDLYHEIYSMPWHRLMSERETFVVTPIVKSRHFRNTQFAALKTKDAIVDLVRKYHGDRPSVNKYDPDFRIIVKIHDEECSVLLDSSGDILFRRGYRDSKFIAPINECLAAGLVLLSDWNQQSNLLDPFCGTGTIAIEAGLIAANIPPMMLREKFGFMEWDEYDESLWKKVKGEAKRKITRPDLTIFAFDKDEAAVNTTISNAQKAGLQKVISVKKQDFFNIKDGHEIATSIIMNPPYDERIGLLDAEDFYSQIGDVYKQEFTGSSAWMISSNLTALKRVGLRHSRRIPLFNGPLECKFVNYQMYAGSKKQRIE